MANNLSAFNPEIWASMIQDILDKSLVGKNITTFEYQAQLTEGDVIHVPYIGNLDANTYVDADGVTIQSVTPTDEYLTVATTKESSFYVQEKDIIQNKYSTARMYQERAAYALQNAMDTALLAEVANAGLSLTAGDLTDGTGTGAITATTTNIIEIFSAAKRKLIANNVKVNGDLFAVVTPEVASLIEQKMATGGFNVTDSALKNGYAGDFLGFKVYVSNNVYSSSTIDYCVFGKKGCIAAVVERSPKVLITQPSDKIGKNFITWDLYGIKTFQIGKDEMVSVNISE